MKFNLNRDKQTYRIDFTLNGKRRRFYPGTSDELTAKNILRQMDFDWEQSQFDRSLEKYKIKNRVQPEVKTVKKIPRLMELWDLWVASLDLPLATSNNHYYFCRVMIQKSGDPAWGDTSWFVKSTLAASTWNRRRGMLKTCVNWGLSEGLIEGKNTWGRLKARKQSNNHANPLSATEVQQILEAFASDRFNPKSSAFKHSYYLPFLQCLFLTAMRPGEVVALQWNHLDFERNLITVSDAMGRDLKLGPYTTRKIRKSTKTEETRYLPMNPALKALLLQHRPDGVNDESPVFPGQKGGVLDTRSFRKAWKQVLEGLGIKYRNPYQTRHTALSHIAANHGLLAAAKVAGHRTLDMVSRHYARYTGDLEDVMPDFLDRI